MGKTVIIVFILGFSIAVPLQATTIGDFNDDGVINISDVVALIMHITGHEEIPEVGRAIDVGDDVVPSPTMGLDGPNAFVADAEQVNPIVLKVLNGVLPKVWPVFNEVDSGTIQGDSYGYAEVFLTNNSHIHEVAPYRTSPLLEFTAVFHDYSDDGALFLGGRMNYSSPLFVSGPELTVPPTYDILGTVLIAGSYNGSFTFQLVVQDYPNNFEVRGRYYILSRKVNGELSGFGGALPEEQNIDGEYYKGWKEIELPE